jgi:hypothetical protein
MQTILTLVVPCVVAYAIGRGHGRRAVARDMSDAVGAIRDAIGSKKK